MCISISWLRSLLILRRESFLSWGFVVGKIGEMMLTGVVIATLAGRSPEVEGRKEG